MHSQFLKRVTDLGLIPGKHRILVAISGGPDSVALTDLISHAGFQFGLAHCDFGLRGKESDDDATFCKELGKFYQVAFHIQKFDMENECEVRKTNVQESARQVRYEYFDLLRREFGYDFIVTGHHADDSVETFFINLLRGTGLNGLKGIPEKNGPVIRPLLYFSRNEIMDFLQGTGLTFRKDSSNSTLKYDRNIIRHKILPQLGELNPSVSETIRHTQVHLKQASDALGDYIQLLAEKVSRHEQDTFIIEKAGVYQCKHGPFLMFHLLHPLGFTSAQCDSAYRLCAPRSLPGKRLESPANTLYANRNELLISPRILVSGEHVIINEAADFSRCKQLSVIEEQRVVSLNQDFLTLDRHQLKFPMVWRSWKQGDRIQPFGMKGTKLVSDLLREKQLNEVQKTKVHVLANHDNEILWVAGIRASEKTRLNGTTTNTFILHYAGAE